MSVLEEHRTLGSVSYKALPKTYTMMTDAIKRLAGPPLAFKRFQTCQNYDNTPTGIPCTANPQISGLSRLLQQSANLATATDINDNMSAPEPVHGPTHESKVTAVDPLLYLNPPPSPSKSLDAKNKHNARIIRGHCPRPRYISRDTEPIDYFDRAGKVTMNVLNEKVQINYKRNKIIEDGHKAMEYEIRQLEQIEGHHDYTDWVIYRHRKEQQNLKAGYPKELGLQPKSKFMLPRYYRQLMKHCPWTAVAYQKERMSLNRTQKVILDPRLVRRQCNAKRRKILAEDATKWGKNPLSFYEDLIWPCEVEAFETDKDDSIDEEDYI